MNKYQAYRIKQVEEAYAYAEQKVHDNEAAFEDAKRQLRKLHKSLSCSHTILAVNGFQIKCDNCGFIWSE